MNHQYIYLSRGTGQELKELGTELYFSTDDICLESIRLYYFISCGTCSLKFVYVPWGAIMVFLSRRLLSLEAWQTSIQWKPTLCSLVIYYNLHCFFVNNIGFQARCCDECVMIMTWIPNTLDIRYTLYYKHYMCVHSEIATQHYTLQTYLFLHLTSTSVIITISQISVSICRLR